MTDDLLTYRLDQLDKSIAALHADLRTHVTADSTNFDAIGSRFGKLHDDVLLLKQKATMWGAVGAGMVLLLGAGAQALGFHLP